MVEGSHDQSTQSRGGSDKTVATTTDIQVVTTSDKEIKKSRKAKQKSRKGKQGSGKEKQESCYQLIQDRRGMIWDLLLYIPTVIALSMIALRLGHSGDQGWSYLLGFLASLFFFIGANRILSTRLMILPSSPLSIEVKKSEVGLSLRSGKTINLVKDVRFFGDLAGKSFGLTGIDLMGSKRQFVFHRGQFESAGMYRDIVARLSIYK